MQNKKLYIIIPLVVLIIAAAAFLAGRLLNGQVGALGFLPFGNGGMSSFTIDMKPAPELPATQPDASGAVVDRKDNTIFLQVNSVDVVGGVSIVGSTGVGENDSPRVEVVMTKETKIYRDATQFDLEDTSGETQTIQQIVEPGSIDEMGKDAFVTAWGRKNGDRIIAEIVLYSNPVMIQP